MPRSSRHKSLKHSKHSSKGYSDSEEDEIKMKEKSSKDENSVRFHRDSASVEKRKISSQVREGKDSKDVSGHGNSDATEEHGSSKRRKDKANVEVGGDRWNGGGEERVDIDRNVEKEIHKGESLKIDSKLKENSIKGESLRSELKIKSKKYESGKAGEKKVEVLASVVADKEETKSKGESRRKSERDPSSRKEEKEVKDKDRRLDKEKNGGHESKTGDAEVKLVDTDVAKKQGSQYGVISEEKPGKRARENTECTVQDELQHSELEKEIEKRTRRKRDGSSERDRHDDDPKEGNLKRVSSKGARGKDTKSRDDKHLDESYSDKYQEDGHKDERRRDEKYWEEADKGNRYRDDKYRVEDEKDARRREDRHREDYDRDNRRKDEKHREDEDRDSRLKDEKYRGGIGRDGRQDDKYYEDGDKDHKHRGDRYHEDAEKDATHRDEKYNEDEDRYNRRRGNSYRDDGDIGRHKDEKYREDIGRDIPHRSSKQGDDFGRDKRWRETKYRDDHTSRDRSGEKSEPKRSRDDGYAGDDYSRKTGAYDDSPTHDDQTTRYRDDQGRRRTNEKEDYGDIRSRITKDERFDAEKRSTSTGRMDQTVDRVRSGSRNAEIELVHGHSRRRSSPTSSSHTPRDRYRAVKQDESKYRDYNYEERVRSNPNSNRDYAGAVGGYEKTFSRSLEKLDQKVESHLGELSAERHLKSDVRSSLMQLVDKSPSSSDRRQSGRPDIRRSVDVGESTQRTGGSRDVKGYPGKEGRGSRELGLDGIPGDDLAQDDADTLSVCSPFMRNSHFSSTSKVLPPPSFRTGGDSPLPFGSAEDDARGKSNIRNRRIGDSNMGRIQGNAWNGVPSWPSPVANGFLPFPHAPPHVGFHSVMQPFPAPPLFGVRPSMELNNAVPYHMPDANRFIGPVRPMGWSNQVDASCPPLHSWDASNAAFGDESNFYRQPDWDNPRNLQGSRGWDTSGDSWKGINRTTSSEVPSSEKENRSAQSVDEDLAGQSVQPAQSAQAGDDEQAESSDIRKSSGKGDAEAPAISLEGTDDVAKWSTKDDVRICHFYLSKLDISADLAENELFDKCTGLIDIDQSTLAHDDDSKILYIEEAVGDKMTSHQVMSSKLFPSTDDSVFQKSMSNYKRQKEIFRVQESEKVRGFMEFNPNSEREDEHVGDKTEELCPTDDVQGVEDALPNFDIEMDPQNGLQPRIDPLVAISMGKSEEPVSLSDHVNMGVSSVLSLGLEEHGLEEKPVSGDPLPSQMKDGSLEIASKMVDNKCGPLPKSDMSSEAMMPESIVSGSVNLSRIHHSPESTH